MTPSVFAMNWVLLLNAASTLFMTGLIWFVQIVHYPLFGSVGTEGFSRYETLHASRTTYVVGPPMLLELGTAAFLAWQRPSGVPAVQAFAGLALVGAIWLSTMLLQIPRHNTLGGGYDVDAHRALVSTNWIRTFAWSARTVLVLWMLAEWKK